MSKKSPSNSGEGKPKSPEEERTFTEGFIDGLFGSILNPLKWIKGILPGAEEK